MARKRPIVRVDERLAHVSMLGAVVGVTVVETIGSPCDALHVEARVSGRWWAAREAKPIWFAPCGSRSPLL